MDPVIIAFFVVLLLSGVFALLGLGGASLYVPIFIWLGIPIEAAVPAGLFLNIVTSGTASFNYRKMLDMKAVSWIIVGALVGAPFGAWLSAILPHQVLIGIFSIVLFAGAYRMLFWKPKEAKSGLKLKESEAGFVEEVGASVSAIATRGTAGGATGTVSGLLGVGGGIFLVPFLIESGFAPKKASVFSHPVVFSASLVGLLSHVAVAPALNYGLMLLTGAAAFVGAFIGSWKMAQGGIVNDELIKKAFSLILILFALKLAIDFATFQGAAFVPAE